MTKRANGEGSGPFRYRSGPSAWQAQIWVTTAEGRRKRVSVYGATYQECLAKKKAMQRDTERGLALASRPATLAKYGQHWLDVVLRSAVVLGRLEEVTRVNYRNIWLRHIAPDLGHVRLDQLTPAVLRQWLVKKSTEHSRLGKPLSPRTQQLVYSVLRKALNDAVNDGLLAENPIKRVPGPRVGTSSATAFTTDEVTSLLVAVADDSLSALWLLLLGTGLRVGEALALSWDDLDLDKRTVVVRGSLARIPGDFEPTLGRAPSRLVVKSTKTAASAAPVALPDAVVAALVAHRRKQVAQRIRARVWHDESIVFATSVGTHFDQRNVLRKFKALAKRAGVEREVHTHELRHTAASLLHAAKVDLRTIQGVLRHTRLATTADVYLHLFGEARREAATAMDVALTRLGQVGQ